MKTLFTAEAVSCGGRSGYVESPDGLLNVTLGSPLEAGLARRGPSPELLFAAAYSACYHGALMGVAKKFLQNVHGSKVHVIVSLLEDDEDGYQLGVELHAHLPKIERNEAEHIMNVAHQTCPYSKALRGNVRVRLVVDHAELLPAATGKV